MLKSLRKMIQLSAVVLGVVYVSNVWANTNHNSHESSRVVKLHPVARVINLQPNHIQLEMLKPFIDFSEILTDDELEDAPTVIALGGEHLVAGKGDKLYASDLDAQNGDRFQIIRQGRTFVDPQTGELLGYLAEQLGIAEVIADGNPATLQLKDAKIEVHPGDMLIPLNDELDLSLLTPQSPEERIDATIIDVMKGVTEIGQYQTVVLNRGEDDALASGALLTLYKRGKLVADPRHHRHIPLPDEASGTLLVYRVFERASLGLILEADRPLHVGDYASSRITG